MTNPDRASETPLADEGAEQQAALATADTADGPIVLEDGTTTVRRTALAFIFVTVVLDVLALGIVIPVLPELVKGFVGNTKQAAPIYGLFGTVWALMQFLFSPVMGALSDRFGRRPVLLISTFGLGLDYILMALAPNLAWLFVGRVISGITSAGYTTAAAYVADVTPVARRAAGFGMLSAAFGMGFVLGPALGGILGQINPRLPFWVAGACTIVGAAYGLFVLPESLPRNRRAPFHWRRECHRLVAPASLQPAAAGNGDSHGFVFSRARSPHEHVCALRRLPLRLEGTRGGFNAGSRGRVLDDRSGRHGAALCASLRRAARCAGRPVVRRRRIRNLRPGDQWYVVLGRHAAHGVMGTLRTLGPKPDDAPSCAD